MVLYKGRASLPNMLGQPDDAVLAIVYNTLVAQRTVVSLYKLPKSSLPCHLRLYRWQDRLHRWERPQQARRLARYCPGLV